MKPLSANKIPKLQKKLIPLMEYAGSSASSAAYSVLAFKGGVVKVTLFLALMGLHNHEVKRSIAIGIGGIFAGCNLLAGAVLGKAGLSNFRQKWAESISQQAKAMLFFKILLGAGANIPSVYLTYITLADLKALPLTLRVPAAVAVATANCIFYSMFNAMGINRAQLRSLLNNKNHSLLTKVAILTLLPPAAIITAIPSAIQGRNFIESMTDNTILAISFAMYSWVINSTLLANANLRVYSSLAEAVGTFAKKCRERDQPLTLTQRPVNAKIAGVILSFLLGLFASVSFPAIFRLSAADYTQNESILNAGEGLNWAMGCGMFAVFFYLTVFHKSDQAQALPTAFASLPSEREALLAAPVVSSDYGMAAVDAPHCNPNIGPFYNTPDNVAPNCVDIEGIEIQPVKEDPPILKAGGGPMP